MGLIAKKFANTDDVDSPLWIEQNHDDYDHRDNGLYIHSADAFGAQSIDDIPAMIETLQAIYDDFEAHKPKTFVEKMEDAKIGSVVAHEVSGGAWMKHDDGDWVSYYGDRHSAKSFNADYKFVYEA